jgi:hypothetical protein
MVLILKRPKAFQCKKEGGRKGREMTREWINERMGEEYRKKEGRR